MKVCLIVDNPIRDLDGLVLLAWHLMKKGVEIIFVPMYEWHEVFFVRPDLVLVNYTRKANHKLIKRCKSLDIAVGVLDTEGGILKDVNDYFNKAMKYGSVVDFYCTWGNNQYDAIISQNVLDNSKVVLTGCPRYDFGVKPLKNLHVNEKNKRKMVLINTNFPFINPKYNTPEKELENLIKKEDYDQKFAKDLFVQTIKTSEKFNNVILKLSNDFPRLDFIIRPHPFESLIPYEILAQTQQNIIVKQEGTVFSWIAQSDLMIHQNCSTAVESILLGVEPVNLKYIGGPLLKQPVSESVSFNVESYKELFNAVERISEGEKTKISETLQKKRNEIITNWFYRIDGKASERVAVEIEKVLLKKKNESREYKLSEIYLSTIKHKDYKKLIIQLIFQYFGTYGLSNIKRMLISRYSTKVINDKNISTKNVEEIVSRISKVDRIKYNYTIDHYNAKKFSSISMKKI